MSDDSDMNDQPSGRGAGTPMAPGQSVVGRARGSSTARTGSFWNYERMITPAIIKVIFWVGVLGCVGAGGFNLSRAVVSETVYVNCSECDGRGTCSSGPCRRSPRGMLEAEERRLEWKEIVSGVLFVILGPVVVRLYCEFMMVVFRINGSLTDIKYELKSGVRCR